MLDAGALENKTEIPKGQDPMDKMNFEFDIREDQLVVTILYPTVW